ncbi:glycosyltransferase [Cyclobacterium jeungdonense]|uniref:Glycosyltransferase n=1 Tax=Cyclobacterium jeungdonense TaxID=708087 RepID=A0ABT8C1D4_9BACT|nr:glycosyltransferase [Cyclobacterium jeungdonense]MDN3686531.1 glycosyltransferase [Cyclobacterium jeungdonense]
MTKKAKKMTKKAKKILVAGIGQSNFIEQLYSNLNKYYPGKFDFDILGLRLFSNGADTNNTNCFTNQYKTRKTVQFKDLINIFQFRLYLTMFNFLRFGASVNFLYFFLKEYIIYATLTKDLLKNNYDLIHFHFPTKDKLGLYWHLKKSQKFIISFWGSDLMRVSGILDYYIQKRVLNDSYRITTHSIELKEQILTKFGRELTNKIFITKFPPEEKLYNLLDEFRPKIDSLKLDFLKNFNIPLFKHLVVIGHNGAKENNHIHILQQLSKIPSSLKEECYFILPFSYLYIKDGIYEKKCMDTLSENNLSGKTLNKFLNWEELALLKLCTKVYIHLPISDALSGTLTEAIYAGSDVITGKWLPYGPFIDAGLKFYSINDFLELSKIFELVIKNEDDENLIQENQLKIRDSFFPDFCSETWFRALGN